MAIGLSQEAMAEAIGVSFQQVQKYEKGANRVSAAALVRIAGVLRCQVSAFVPGSAAPALLPEIDDFTLKSLAEHLPRLNSAGRQVLIDLAAALTSSSALRNTPG
jgi:transcriptional regulator with XRE-family HTH domain